MNKLFHKKASIYLVFLSGWWEAGIKDCPKIFEIVQILWILHNLKYFWTILYSWPFSPETFNFQIIWVFFLNFPSIFRSILTKFFTALKVNQSTKIKKRYWFSKFCFILFIFWKLSFAGRSDCHTTKPCARTPYSVQTSNQNKKNSVNIKKWKMENDFEKVDFQGNSESKKTCTAFVLISRVSNVKLKRQVSVRSIPTPPVKFSKNYHLCALTGSVPTNKKWF